MTHVDPHVHRSIAPLELLVVIIVWGIAPGADLRCHAVASQPPRSPLPWPPRAQPVQGGGSRQGQQRHLSQTADLTRTKTHANANFNANAEPHPPPESPRQIFESACLQAAAKRAHASAHGRGRCQYCGGKASRTAWYQSTQLHGTVVVLVYARGSTVVHL